MVGPGAEEGGGEGCHGKQSQYTARTAFRQRLGKDFKLPAHRLIFRCTWLLPTCVHHVAVNIQVPGGKAFRAGCHKHTHGSEMLSQLSVNQDSRWHVAEPDGELKPDGQARQPVVTLPYVPALQTASSTAHSTAHRSSLACHIPLSVWRQALATYLVGVKEDRIVPVVL
jgi:hypothetical protein